MPPAISPSPCKRTGKKKFPGKYQPFLVWSRGTAGLSSRNGIYLAYFIDTHPVPRGPVSNFSQSVFDEDYAFF
jgi:hypothetical protein